MLLHRYCYWPLFSYFAVGHLWLRSVFHCVCYFIGLRGRPELHYLRPVKDASSPASVFHEGTTDTIPKYQTVIGSWCSRILQAQMQGWYWSLLPLQDAWTEGEGSDWVHQVQQMVSRWLWSSAKGHSRQFRSRMVLSALWLGFIDGLLPD